MAPRSSRRRFLTRGSQAVVGTSLLPFAGCSDSGPRARVPAGLIENVEAQIPALLAAARVPGLSIAIVRDGKLAWARSFGVKRSGTTDDVDERRRYARFLSEGR
jgi:CubicO group peptidase (beta-lactamase class C family)